MHGHGGQPQRLHIWGDSAFVRNLQRVYLPVTHGYAFCSATPTVVPVQCKDRDIEVSVDKLGAGTSHLYWNVVFFNTGSTTCTLHGAPSVTEAVSAKGAQVETAAKILVPTDNTLVTLDSYGHAYARLVSDNVTAAGGPFGKGACKPVKAGGFRIYAPNGVKAYFVSEKNLYRCATGADVLIIAAVNANLTAG